MLYNQFWRGTLKKAKEAFSSHLPKGELTLLIEGQEISLVEPPSDRQLEHELSALISNGHSLSSVILLLNCADSNSFCQILIVFNMGI